MKLSELKNVLEQGKQDEFYGQLKKGQLVGADYSLLLMQIIKKKIKDFSKYFNILLQKGADVNFAHSGGNKKSQLMVACQQGNAQSVDLLCCHPKINFQLQDIYKKTAPYYAIQNKNKADSEQFLKKLLKFAPHLIKKSANNETMLVLAIKKQKLELVKILLINGAQPNYIIPDSGNTALHEAIKNCKSKQMKVNKDIVKILYQYGADPSITNKKGKDCYEFADKYPLKELLNEVKREKTNTIIAQPLTLPVNKSASQSLETIGQQKKRLNIDSKVQKAARVKVCPINSQQKIDICMGNADRLIFQNKSLIKTQRKPLEQVRKQMASDLILSDDEQSDQQLWQVQKSTFQQSSCVYQKLDSQILQYSNKCSTQFNQSTRQTNSIITRLRDIAYKQDLQMQIYGSFSTGLWLSHSDIDILLIPPHQYIDQIGQNYVENTLEKIENRLRKENFIRNFTKNNKIKIPVIRFDIQVANRTYKVQITVLSIINNGLDISHYISDHMKMYPLLKPLFFSIKSLTVKYKLSDSKNGGIRTYAIIIMLIQFLRNIEQDIMKDLQVQRQLQTNLMQLLGICTNYDQLQKTLIQKGINIPTGKTPNFSQFSLGYLLSQFCLFFGFKYQYSYYSISENRMDNIYGRQPKISLDILNPLNHSNNVSKYVKAYELQCMFKTAYIALHTQTHGSKLQFMFECGKIIHPI